MAHGVGCVSQAWMDPRVALLGITGAPRHFFLLPSLKAGCFGVQIPLCESKEKEIIQIKSPPVGILCENVQLYLMWCRISISVYWKNARIKFSLASHWPLTCCSKLSMTATAWWRMSSLVWGFSLFRCSWHIRPSSLKASLMSRTLRRSRALLAILLSRSRSAFCSGFRSSSSVMLWEREEIHLQSDLLYD